MQNYENSGGNSGIIAFAIGDDYIVVQFNSGRSYTYSYRNAGVAKVEQMKKLALSGEGLNSYISKYARDDYDK